MTARIRGALPSIVVFVAVLVFWEFALAALDVKQFLLPRPSVIVAAFADQADILVAATLYTATEVVGGLLVGCTLGILAAFAAGRWAAARGALLPIGVGMSAIPIIAMAPIMNIWFSSESPVSRMAIVAVLVFFPMMVNTMRGLGGVDAGSLELMAACAASEGQVLRKIRVPNALPFIFTGLKVATTLAVIGAIVGEYFGGALNALGVLINTDAQIFQFQTAWAGILVASLLGIALYSAVVAAERGVLRWSPQQQDS